MLYYASPQGRNSSCADPWDIFLRRGFLRCPWRVLPVSAPTKPSFKLPYHNGSQTTDSASAFQIPFGDHPLNLERYREYSHGPCARITRTNAYYVILCYVIVCYILCVYVCIYIYYHHYIMCIHIYIYIHIHMMYIYITPFREEEDRWEDKIPFGGGEPFSAAGLQGKSIIVIIIIIITVIIIVSSNL